MDTLLVKVLEARTLVQTGYVTLTLKTNRIYRAGQTLKVDAIGATLDLYAKVSQVEYTRGFLTISLRHIPTMTL